MRIQCGEVSPFYQGQNMTAGNRSLVAYSLFAIIALMAVLLLSQMQVPYPHPSQAESLRLEVIGPILALGCLGAWLFGWLKVVPASEGKTWPRMVGMAVILGLAFGLLAVALDTLLGLSKTMAQELRIHNIHLPWPYAPLAYTAGAVVVESLYRIIPIPLVLFLVTKLLLRGRGLTVTFWVVAVLTALLEPVSQAGILSQHPTLMICVALFIFVVNLVGAWLLRRYGVAAPLLMRITLYGVWHVTLGPMLIGA